jgi:hypothetical protein
VAARPLAKVASGGEHLAGTSLAHAEALLQKRPEPAPAPSKRRTRA